MISSLKASGRGLAIDFGEKRATSHAFDTVLFERSIVQKRKKIVCRIGAIPLVSLTESLLKKIPRLKGLTNCLVVMGIPCKSITEDF